MLQIFQLPVLTDNYIYLIHESISNKTAVVDPAVARPVLKTLEKNGWHLDFIFNTHHHWDHVNGNLELKKKTGCKVIASHYDFNRIPGIDISVNHGDLIELGHSSLEILATPGHTLGHIALYCADSQALFCGDTLFSMGCGRLFEGTAAQMWTSLQILKSLPGPTRVYCAHEYTLANGNFAIGIDSNNPVLEKRLAEVKKLRSENRPTVPSTMEQEWATNPFLRADCHSVRETLEMPDQPAIEVFTKIRALKDRF